jgi:hypothetical protein
MEREEPQCFSQTYQRVLMNELLLEDVVYGEGLR